MVSDSQPSELTTTTVEVPFETLAALLGAASAGRTLAGSGGANAARMLDAFDAFSTPGALATQPSPETTAQLAREVALLKLRAFRSLCRVLAAAEDPDQELLSLQVIGVLRLSPLSPAPARWQFELGLQLGDQTLGIMPGHAGAADGRPTLGLLLAKLLLVHDAQSGDRVEALVGELAERLDGGAGAAKVREQLAQDASLDARAVLFDSDRRELLAEPPLPRSLWADVLAEAVLLAAPGTAPRASAPAAPRPPGAPAAGPLAAALPGVLKRVDQLSQQLSVEAFGRAARDAELRRVLQEHARRGHG
ncbi:MAG: hypothetical protein H6835_07845 [Planctomycetes bacterium]|nr:hypothetical protein [Planctomycetota bacterium]